MNLSVDLSKHSVDYSTGDVLVIYAVIIAVAIGIVVITYLIASKKERKSNRHNPNR